MKSQSNWASLLPCVATSAYGQSRHFAWAKQSGRFWREADINRQAKPAGLDANDPKRTVVNQYQLQTLLDLVNVIRLNPDGDLSGISRLGPDLARNIEAYPAYLPILWNLQEGRV
jgi:hypothetical protein